MFRKYLPSFFLIILVAISTYIVSRPFRINQIPNGANVPNNNGDPCLTCHATFGGSPRNSFGLEIESNFLSVPGAGGNVQWGPDLAAIDSDGDGFTNGEELQDPNGAWSQGQADPGDPNLVSNPGDAQSTPPPVTDVEDLAELPSAYKLDQNYPNPFNPSTKINFAITNAEQVSLKIYNNLGQQVAELVNQFLPAGSYTVNFDVLKDAGNLSSGFYFYNLVTPSFTQTKKMILLK